MSKFENEIEKLLYELERHCEKGVCEIKFPYGTYNINIKKLKEELLDENYIRSNSM